MITVYIFIFDIKIFINKYLYYKYIEKIVYPILLYLIYIKFSRDNIERKS